MRYKYLGTYKDYKVFTGARNKNDVAYNDPTSIYLVPTGTGNYWMLINGRICGYCDANYCVEEFNDPAEQEVEELNFTASSWTTDPNPQVVEEEPKPAPVPQPTTSSSDFWTRVQEEIDSTLKAASLNKDKPFVFDFE